MPISPAHSLVPTYSLDTSTNDQDLDDQIDQLSEDYLNLTREAAQGRYAEVAWHGDECRYALAALIGGLENFNVTLVAEDNDDSDDTLHQLANQIAAGPLPEGFEKSDLIYIDVHEALDADFDGQNLRAFLDDCFEARAGVVAVLRGVERLRSWRYESLRDYLSACMRGGLQVVCTVTGNKDTTFELPRVEDMIHVHVNDARHLRLVYHLCAEYCNTKGDIGVEVDEMAMNCAADIAMDEQGSGKINIDRAKARASELIDLAIGELRLRSFEDADTEMVVTASLVKEIAELA